MLSVKTSVTLDDIKKIKSSIQGRLDTLSKSLNIKVASVKLDGITSNRSEIQKSIDQIASKLSIKIENIKITNKSLNDLKAQLKNQSFNVEANIKQNGKLDTTSTKSELDQATQSANRFNQAVNGINSSQLETVNRRFSEIKTNIDKLAQQKITLDANGNLQKEILTYKNAIGEVVTETYGWKQANAQLGNGEEFVLLNTQIGKSQETLENVKVKAEELKNVASSLVQSFASNGQLSGGFVSELQNQLNNINTDKGSKELEEFVNYLNRLKGNESQIISIKSNLDKLNETYQTMTSGKKIDLLDDSQVVAINQVQKAIQNTEVILTQLQNGATTTSAEIGTISNAVNNINPSQLDTVNKRFSEIRTTIDGLAQQKITLDASGNLQKEVLTYKNAIGQVVTETYGWKQANAELGTGTEFTLLSTQISKSQEAIENARIKTEELRNSAAGLIQSFSGNGQLNSSFISELQNQLNNISTEKGTKELEKFVSYLNRLKTNENQIISVKNNLDKLNKTYQTMTSGKKIELMDTNQVAAINQTQTAMQNAEATLTQLQNGAVKTSTEIRTITTAGTQAGNALKDSFTTANTVMTGFGNTLKNIATYFLGGSVIMLGIQAIKNGFQELEDIDTALIDISRVTAEGFDLTGYTQQANEMARELNQTTQAILTTSYEVQKLGYDLDESGTKIVELASKFSNVGDITIDEAMGSLVTVLKGFGVAVEDTEEVATRAIDSFNEVGNRFAIGAGNIGNAFRSSAASLSLSGTTIEESIGLITASYEVLQDDKMYVVYKFPLIDLELQRWETRAKI